MRSVPAISRRWTPKNVLHSWWFGQVLKLEVAVYDKSKCVTAYVVGALKLECRCATADKLCIPQVDSVVKCTFKRLHVNRRCYWILFVHNKFEARNWISKCRSRLYRRRWRCKEWVGS